MSQETKPPFTKPVTLKVYADLLGRPYSTVCRWMRSDLLPRVDCPGRPLIPADYANRVFKNQSQKTA